MRRCERALEVTLDAVEESLAALIALPSVDDAVDAMGADVMAASNGGCADAAAHATHAAHAANAANTAGHTVAPTAAPIPAPMIGADSSADDERALLRGRRQPIVQAALAAHAVRLAS